MRNEHITDERLAFENAARKEGCTDFKRVGDAYTDRRTLRCYRIWQRALALRPAAQPADQVAQRIPQRDGEPMPPPGPWVQACPECTGCMEWGGNGLWHHWPCSRIPKGHNSCWLEPAPAAQPVVPAGWHEAWKTARQACKAGIMEHRGFEIDAMVESTIISRVLVAFEALHVALSAASAAQPVSDQVPGIESPFNACMHKAYCLSLKAQPAGKPVAVVDGGCLMFTCDEPLPDGTRLYTGQTPLPEHADHVPEIAARLRLVAKLAGCPEAVPQDDEIAVGAIFSVLGNMRFKLERLPRPAPTTDAARDVLAERQRQIESEGWTPEHDDVHEIAELAHAAACYTLADLEVFTDTPPAFWPWAPEWWKPRDRRRNLIKAGALILAEIERFDRAAKKGAQP